MARYTDDSRERVRDAADFAEIVGARTELRRSGISRLEGLCPFHDERSPSFGINPVEKVYYCFGCGAGGDVFKFVMETEGLDFQSALESLAERYRVTLEREAEDPRDAMRRQRRDRLLALLERTAAYYVRVLWESPGAADARAYLTSRGLEEAALRAYRVGFAPDEWERVVSGSRRTGYSDDELLATGLATRSRRGTLVDRFRGRITFPLTDERGRVLGFGARAMSAEDKPKYLNTSESELFHKGRIVYGADMARAAAAKAGRVVLVEGYTDVIALHQAGVPETVAQMGTALTDAQVDAIARLAPRALFCQDPDRAGQESVAKGIESLRSHNAGRRATRAVEFRIVRLPAGQDPADVVQQSGAEALRALLEQAIEIERFEVERALDAGLSADAVLDAVGPIIGSLPENALRASLVQLVDGRLGLGPNVINAALQAPARRPNAPTDGGGWQSRPQARPWEGRPAPPARAAEPPPVTRPAPTPAAAADPILDGDPGPMDAPPPEWDGFTGDDAPPPDGDAGPPPPAQTAPAGPPPARETPAGGHRDWGAAPPPDWVRSRPGDRDRDRGWGGRQRRGGGRDRFRGPEQPLEPIDPRQALAKREQTEEAFLSYCLALPELGEERLAAVDIDDYFSAAGTRRAAAYLRGRLRAPMAEIPQGDDSLAHVIAQLVVTAGTLEATRAKFELEALQLDLHRLERHISTARVSGATGVRDLAVERQRVLDEIRHRLL